MLSRGKWGPEFGKKFPSPAHPFMKAKFEGLSNYFNTLTQSKTFDGWHSASMGHSQITFSKVAQNTFVFANNYYNINNDDDNDDMVKL